MYAKSLYQSGVELTPLVSKALHQRTAKLVINRFRCTTEVPEKDNK